MLTLKGYLFPRLVNDEPSGSMNEPAPPRLRPLNQSLLPDIKDDMMFQIFVLGARSAGKTVFLASLYHLMSVQDKAGSNFILNCHDIKSQHQLRSTFVQISNPDQAWPAGTPSINEYVFDCEHVKPDKRVRLFRLKYYDFPGGYISDANSEQALNFIKTEVSRAHSILVLLDGKKIRNVLDKVPPPERESSIFEDLDMMVGFLQSSIGKPLHFAVTKSDILHPKLHSLAKIRRQLLKHDGFRKIAEQQTRPVYLVPVSAVGDKFAQFDPVSQQMRKRADGMVSPSFVDVPLTFTLVDYLRRLLAELDPDDENRPVYDWLWRKAILIVPLVATVLAGPIVSNLMHLLYPGNPTAKLDYAEQALISIVATLILGAIFKFGGVRLETHLKAMKKVFDDAQADKNDRKSIMDVILKRQISRADRYSRRYPESVLATEDGAAL